MTVTLSGQGTSTAGTDYASLSTITISAGSTTGTTHFNPTDDSFMRGSETAIIAITVYLVVLQRKVARNLKQ